MELGGASVQPGAPGAPERVPMLRGCWSDFISGPAREMRETNGLLREEVEGLQRKLGRQEKMQENLVDLELEKEVRSPSGHHSPRGVLSLWRTLDVSVPCPSWSPKMWTPLCCCGGQNSGPQR